MRSTAILDLMVRDHARLLDYLKDVESHLGDDFGFLSNSFNRFEWNLEKHFFVEERAIFTWYNPDEIDESYDVFLDLSKQHTLILEKVEMLRKKLQHREPFSLNELKKLLVQHKTFEENNIYPVLDQKIAEGEKRFIIERIKDIRL
jgi:hemerythrin superfamily protein